MVSLSRKGRYSIACIMMFVAVTASDSAYLMESTESERFSSEKMRCAIALEDGMYSKDGLCSGFNYELLRQFASDCHRNVEIVTARKGENYIDSLRLGTVDIVVLPSGTCQVSDSIAYSSSIGDNTVWAVRNGNITDIKAVNTWLGYYVMTPGYAEMHDRFFASYGSGKRLKALSPYDRIIRQYADTLGWDWRMLAAVVYQESRFSINSLSGRGASGLMQVMPKTAEYYEISDLTDPEENIKAGTMHLSRLQSMFRDSDMDRMERIRFTLAAYNAGEGRIADCRNLASSMGLDSDKWEDIVKAIPAMREDSILTNSNVRLGKFQGNETIKYVDNVMDIYDRFCKAFPS